MMQMQKYWHQLFEAGVFLKALNGAWETVGGIFFLTAGPAWVVSRFGPYEVVSRYLHPISPGTQLFVSAYLLAHGAANFFLAYNLFRNRSWSYSVSIAFTAILWVYQLFRFTHTRSPILLGIIIFDVLFILLTWHEYQYQK